jgi:hypothetical protein
MQRLSDRAAPSTAASRGKLAVAAYLNQISREKRAPEELLACIAKAIRAGGGCDVSPESQPGVRYRFGDGSMLEVRVGVSLHSLPPESSGDPKGQNASHA